jgi:hypothetical protein
MPAVILRSDEGVVMPRKSSKKSVENNEKAVKFQEFLIENNINVFSTESMDDDYATVLFRSRIEARGQILPMAILIDTSIFTVIRTQIISGLPEDKKIVLFTCQKVTDERKGMRYLEDAMQQLPDVRLIRVGKGGDYEIHEP